MFKILLLLVLPTIANLSYSNDSFWGDRTQVKYLDNTLPSTQGLDMAEFNENFSKTTSEIRQGYINEAEQLMKAGASGGQALKMVLAFDDRVYDRRQLAKKGMGKTIASYFNAGLESIYDNFENRGGKRLIEVVGDQSNYRAELLWGVMPGSGVYATLKLYNEINNTSRSFSTRAKVQNINSLGRVLALLVFNSLHKTMFPLKRKIGRKSITVNGLETFTTRGSIQYRTMLQTITRMCKSFGSRIATFDELNYFFARGFYKGGFNMGNHTWAGLDYKKDYGYMNWEHPMGTTNYLVMKPYSRTLKYACVTEESSNFSGYY